MTILSRDDINTLILDQGKGILSKKGAPTGDRRVKGCGIALGLRPSSALQVRSCSAKVQIRDADDVNTGRGPGLCQVHRGKFSAANDGDTHRLVLGLASRQHAREIHGVIRRGIKTGQAFAVR